MGVKEALKLRYRTVHPLVFHRAVEKTKTDVELFDLLETLPEFPFCWDDDKKRFVTTDLLQTEFLRKK